MAAQLKKAMADSIWIRVAVKTLRARRSAPMESADQRADVVLLPLLGRLRAHGGQVGDGVGDHPGRPGVGVGELLLRRDHPAHAAVQHEDEHADQAGHHERDGPGHDPEDHDGTDAS